MKSEKRKAQSESKGPSTKPSSATRNPRFLSPHQSFAFLRHSSTKLPFHNFFLHSPLPLCNSPWETASILFLSPLSGLFLNSPPLSFPLSFLILPSNVVVFARFLSPSGKLVQIEHALTAVGSGQTSLGIKGILTSTHDVWFNS